MRSDLYVAISNPTDYYFLNLPVEAKCNLPGSAVYNFIKVQRFLDQLIEKYPGNIRDLAGTVGASPQLLFVFAQANPDDKPRPTFSDLISHQTMITLIKFYYKYVLATNPNMLNQE